MELSFMRAAKLPRLTFLSSCAGPSCEKLITKAFFYVNDSAVLWRVAHIKPFPRQPISLTIIGIVKKCDFSFANNSFFS